MQLQRLSDLFWKLSPRLFVLSNVLNLISGLGFALLVPFVMHVINGDKIDFSAAARGDMSFFDSPTSATGIWFVLGTVVVLSLKAASEIMAKYIASKGTVEHRLYLYRRISALAIADLERIGFARVMNVLNVDVPAITNAAMAIPSLWLHSVIVVGLLGYLAYLNLAVFGFVVAATVFGVVTYQLPVRFGSQRLLKARDHFDKVQEGTRGLILGAKELKLNREKSRSYYHGDLEIAEHASQKEGLKAAAIFTGLDNYGEALSYFVIAAVVFHLPYVLTLTRAELIGIVIALLYLAGPVASIIASSVILRQGQVSLLKLKEFHEELHAEAVDDLAAVGDDWDAVHLHEVGYSYPQRKEPFSLQPVSLTFRRGQVSFIVGGNGSGKSTLSKCISLHYRPSCGHVAFGNERIDAHNIESARQRVSVIYTDFYLFPRLMDPRALADKEAVARYLRYLELDGKVQIVDGVFSTTSLSDGQRKRLAMLVVLLEDREICVFDEWAADQDPRFKDVFYRTILPELKARGKVVIVITHDDRYFGCADQIVTMESGALKSVKPGDPADLTLALRA